MNVLQLVALEMGRRTKDPSERSTGRAQQANDDGPGDKGAGGCESYISRYHLHVTRRRVAYVSHPIFRFFESL